MMPMMKWGLSSVTCILRRRKWLSMEHCNSILNSDGSLKLRFLVPCLSHFRILMLMIWWHHLSQNLPSFTWDTGQPIASTSIENSTNRAKIILSISFICANLNSCKGFSRNTILILSLMKLGMRGWLSITRLSSLTPFSREATLMLFTMSKGSSDWWPEWTRTQGATAIIIISSRFRVITDRVKCNEPGTYTFRIVNMSKRMSLYQRGMKPYVKTNLNPVWRQDGANVRYGPSLLG